MEFINNKEGDLDMLIASHRNYAGEIAKKITLYYPKSGKEVNISTFPYSCVIITRLSFRIIF